ncbi:MAG: L-histidine N(alpha)-methyltransferase, partial [Leptospiraceae bacterium]|nr:L-histidine N(alpha)-methyltransferase [Leptospiraceae bacterium]
FAIDVLTGLCSIPKQLSAKYFYDDTGSEIFQKITQHEDYYLTKTEFRILNEIKYTLPQIIGEDEIDIIELGAGDGHKTQIILEGFLERNYKVNYYPIDISEKAMTMLETNINSHKNLKVHGIVAEYFDGLRYLRSKSLNKQLVLFLGSNIGNFNRAQNQGFLRRLWNSLNALDYVLIGFDLKKNISILTRAYNDSAGYTREFNLNLLRRINRDLGGDFDLNKFQHFGIYNPILGSMESYLLAIEEHDIYIKELEHSFHFDAFEPIHLEYSFKFLKSDIEFMSKHTGFKVIQHFSDTQEFFIDSLWKVTKENRK